MLLSFVSLVDGLANPHADLQELRLDILTGRPLLAQLQEKR